MELSKWLNLERGRAAALAVALGIKPPQVADWVTGKKPVPANHCQAIERWTNGAVTRMDLLPNDWRDYWPDLGDPAIPGV